MTPFRAHMARLDAPVGPPAAKRAAPARAVAKASAKRVHVHRAPKAKKIAHARPHRRRPPAQLAAARSAPAAPLLPGGMTPYRGGPAATPAPLESVVPITLTVCENPTAVAAPLEAGPPPRVGGPGGFETLVLVPPLLPPDDLTPFVDQPLSPPPRPPFTPPLGPPTETGVVPEPATWTMMILGFGMLGATLRRRPRSQPGRRPRRLP